MADRPGPGPGAGPGPLPGLEESLADLAESGRRHAAPPAPERIRARGEQRLRRRRAALASGGALLAAAVALGGLSLVRAARDPEPPAVLPTAAASPFVPPVPAPGAEYAEELAYVYDAVAEGDTVRVTVEPLRTVRGGATPTGEVHTLTLPRGTPVEARRLSGGNPADLRLDELLDRLAAGRKWAFAIDYDGEGRVHSLREAYWLGD
ncbi:hypothetical protein ACQ9AR_01155 [Streptomyces lividans]|uniref:Integral membrane protein n=2 Tax=Streptomyces TaxID=1883 RepID=Q9X8Z0_STRCO|nr:MULTISPECIES: hypothetical protein [Streptomyces]QSJ10457.1 hypothetical protein SLIVDG2_19755 [Streptomyces lividans]AIJ14898.1 hypothetical protein SLIV_19755 [Streptomyces lividans TK24]EFD68311.1 integral membrane protein [Streptomyces lividans TK24]KKD15773.1 membrane protein [Streptomyces sp. WM6391]MBQ0952680.1 hypothetical protein [Streptomyces sp. RK76]